jgi:ABC-type transport system involved in cytochrome c biogenesis permease subunit
VNAIPLALYLAAGVLYAAHFVTRAENLGRSGSAVLTVGAVAHSFVIGMQTMAAGHLPIAGVAQAISVFVLLLALGYLHVELTTGERALGVFIAPLLVLLQLLRVLSPVSEKRVPVLESPWFAVHVSSLLFAYACLALAFVVGLTYVLLFKEIKARQLGFFYRRLPPLESLDVMNARTIALGWVFMTVGVIVGAIWTVQARQAPVVDPRVLAISLADPKILGALATWAVYTFALYARARGFGGRRAAYISVVGFAIVLFNFVPIGYFLTRSHNFGG